MKEEEITDKLLSEKIAKYVKGYYFHDSSDVRRADETAAAIAKEVVEPLIKEAKKQERINTLKELRDMWAYEMATGRAVMSIKLDRWIEYCRKAGIEEDWWELNENKA